jgi:23S rRNA (cytosine1962-C5)-methyltransferase
MPKPEDARPVVVTARGAARLAAGHPWVYRSDVARPPAAPGFAPVHDARGRTLGWAAVHPTSQIAVRLMHVHDTPVDEAVLVARLRAAVARRAALADDPDAHMDGVTGYRIVHGEADGLPGLVVDRLGPVLVVQNGSAALEPYLEALVDALVSNLAPTGVLGRFDAPAREHEGLPRTIRTLAGEVPETVEVNDGRLIWPIRPLAGQKTGTFLDQRLNHRRLASHARGAALDAFAYQGGFGLHLLRAGATSVELVDSSAAALAQAVAAADRNGLPPPQCTRADAFERLRELDREGARFDTISVDPPALAKRARDLPRAMAAYKELNLRALRLLTPDGVLGTSSCSAHLQEAEFLNVLADAAADARRTVHVLGRFGAAPDHPERLGFPESRYLKFVLLQAVA